MMRLLSLVIISLFFGIFCCDLIAEEEIYGTWSNKQAEFKTMGFSLRKDGTGIISTVAGAGLCRWEKTTDGIRFKGGPNGKQDEMVFVYNSTDKSFVWLRNSKETNIFWKISNQEPPNYEEQYRESEKQRIKDFQSQRKTTTETFLTADGLIHRLESFLDLPSESAPHPMAEVKATNFFNFRVELSNGRIFTSVLLLHKASARPSPGSEYAWGKFEMPTNLPTLLALPESKVNKLTNYLEAEKISRSEPTARAIGLEGVEGYLKQIEITHGTNKTEAMKTFAFLLNGLVDTNSYPIKLTITEKK